MCTGYKKILQLFVKGLNGSVAQSKESASRYKAVNAPPCSGR